MTVQIGPKRRAKLLAAADYLETHFTKGALLKKAGSNLMLNFDEIATALSLEWADWEGVQCCALGAIALCASTPLDALALSRAVEDELDPTLSRDVRIESWNDGMGTTAKDVADLLRTVANKGNR